MELKTLENWLWRAACAIRGAADAPKYKDYILPNGSCSFEVTKKDPPKMGL